MKIESITDLLRIVYSYQTLHVEERLYFRGESRNIWDLRPSVMRDGLIKFEKDMLTDLMIRQPDQFTGAHNAISQWVLAQHHGLKTRFLDITRNPLVALFHACEHDPNENGRLHIFAVPGNMIQPFNSDSVSVVANFSKLVQSDQEMLLTQTSSQLPHEYPDAMSRLFQLVREEKPYIEEPTLLANLFRVFVIEPQQSSERIRAQSGAFLASAFHHRFERDEIARFTSRFSIYAHYTPTIQASSKEGILSELRLLNITRETLFPGLDESAKAITDAYHQRLQADDHPVSTTP